MEKDDWLLYKEKMTGEGYDYAPATEPYISYKGTVVASIVAHYPIPYRRFAKEKMSPGKHRELDGVEDKNIWSIGPNEMIQAARAHGKSVKAFRAQMMAAVPGKAILVPQDQFPPSLTATEVKHLKEVADKNLRDLMKGPNDDDE